MKRKAVGFLSLSMAAFMVLQTPATVSAETIWVDGNYTDEDGNTQNKVEHDGDLTTGEEDKDEADSEGNIWYWTAAGASDNCSLSVNGNATGIHNATAVTAADGGDVSVTGNASAADALAVTAEGSGSTARVDGDAASQNAEAVAATNGGSVSVGGDATSNSSDASAIYADNSSSVLVEGDAVSNNSSVCIDLTAASGSGSVVVLGTVSASGEGNSIWINIDETNMSNFGDSDAVLQALPTIIVGELAAKDEGYYLWNSYSEALLLANSNDSAAADSVNEAIYDKIQYRINVQNPSNGSINVTGASQHGGYLVANEDAELSVTITVDDGYELSSVSGGNATVVRNADGTYQIIVPRGGGVDISAVIRALAQASEEADASAQASKDAGAPVQVLDLRYANFQKVVQSLVAQIPQNGTLNLEMGEWISFNRKTFETFSKRPDMSIVITYTYMDHRYRVTIPAGYPVMDLLNEEGYCGCLYLSAVFGSEMLD